MIEWRIRRFVDLTAEELYDLLQLRCDVFVVEQQCAYPDIDGRDRGATHVLGYSGERLAACSRILPPGLSYPEASIGRIATSRGERGRGLGAELVRRSISEARAIHPGPIKIGAQSYLRTFYSGFGFVPVSDEYLEDGIPHMDMLLDAGT